MTEDECVRGTSIDRDQIEKRSRAASACGGKNALVVGASSGEIPKTFGSPVRLPFYGRGVCAAELASDQRSFWSPRPRWSHPKTSFSSQDTQEEVHSIVSRKADIVCLER